MANRKTDEELQALADARARKKTEDGEDYNPLREFVKRHSEELKTKLLETETGFIMGPDRNDPCPCGSGKKYKKCCGLTE